MFSLLPHTTPDAIPPPSPYRPPPPPPSVAAAQLMCSAMPAIAALSASTIATAVNESYACGLSLFPYPLTHSLTLLFAHSLSVLAPATLRTVSVCVCMCVCCCTRQNTITRIHSHSRSLPPATTAPTTRRAHRNSSHLCMICVFHSRSPPLSLTLFHTRSLSTCQPKINEANAAGQVTCGRASPVTCKPC